MPILFILLLLNYTCTMTTIILINRRVTNVIGIRDVLHLDWTENLYIVNLVKRKMISLQL